MFREFLETQRNETDRHLDVFFRNQESTNPLISYCYTLMKDYVSGGKRLRPVALILAYNASGGKDRKIYLPAVALELHHTYSMILDDIMDEDDYRRGKPAIHKSLKDYFLKYFKEENYDGSLFSRKSSRFAVSYGIMLGNLTNILSKKAILESGFADRIVGWALKATEGTDELLYHGQMMDLFMEYADATEESYLEMIKLKTGLLFGLSLELGSLLAGADESRQHLFRKFGISFATSFQLQDDLLDLAGSKGHEIGSDIRKGKKTLLMIKTLEKAGIEQKKYIMKVSKSKAGSDEIKKVIQIMESTGSVDYCRKLALSKNQEAKAQLDKLGLDTYYTKMFSEFTDYMLERKR
jgi:geranylgeranyl diphosphate synthase, type I